MSIGQKKALSDFLNTVSAAWLATGVIAPVFTPMFSKEELISSLISGFCGSLALLFISLILVREVNV